jgi:hypothetical protein
MAKVIFRLTIEGKTPSTWELPQSNVMGIKQGKGKKFINYYPGEDSCFVEDIFAKNKDLEPSKVPLFKFNPQSGATDLLVDDSNISLLNYLKIHPWFEVRYNIFSKEKEATENLAQFENVEKALELIKESDEIKVKAISMAIFGLNSFYKTYTQCAAELKAKAIKDPYVIISAMEATNYETKFVAGLAFVSGIIKLNPTHTAITWSDNDGLILHVAQGENGLDKLTNFLTNETKEAQVLLQEFNTRLVRKEKTAARSDDSDKLLSEKDAEIAELKRQLEASKATIQDAVGTKEEEDDEDLDGKSALEQLQEDYVNKFKSEVPIRYKNDEVWLAKKLAE